MASGLLILFLMQIRIKRGITEAVFASKLLERHTGFGLAQQTNEPKKRS
jgi:hypothetical protein